MVPTGKLKTFMEVDKACVAGVGELGEVSG